MSIDFKDVIKKVAEKDTIEGSVTVLLEKLVAALDPLIDHRDDDVLAEVLDGIEQNSKKIAKAVAENIK